MHILPALPEHVPALSRLACETFAETFGHLYPSEDLSAFLDKSYSEVALLPEVADSAQFWRMAFDETGKAVAYLHCGPVGLPHPDARPKQEGELKRLYVHSSQQGKGLGKVMLTTALDYLAKQYGPAPQWIGVWSENAKAQALYMSHGFEKVGEYQFPVGNTLDDEFILRRIP